MYGIVKSIFLLLIVSILAMPSQAQKYLGGLTGSVTDPTGARIANAEVTATDTITKFVSKTTTNSAGEYTVPFITPSTYDVSIKANGFGPQAKTGVIVTAGDSVSVDFTLKIGKADEAIVVTADSVQLDTQSAILSTTVSAAEVVDTPLIGRNPFVFTTLAAGVETGAYTTSKASGFTNPFSGTAIQVTVNGNSGHVRLTLDGIPDDPAERLSGTNYTGFVPSPEAVQEVKVQIQLFDAQYGHGDGVENTVLRSGTNKYHGAAYYVFQNTYMNANTSERVPNQNGQLNPASPLHRSNDQWSQPGFVFDGPVTIPHLYDGHDRTFFMVAYERIQARSLVSYTTSGLVPTAAERTGDFSALCSAFTLGVCNAGAGIQIYDPTQPVAANGNRVPFLNNKIPASYFAAGSAGAPGAALMALYPLPNSNSSPTINYIPANTAYPERYYSFVTRIDHSFSQVDKLNASFYKAVLNQIQPPNGFPTAIGSTGSGYTVYRNDVGGSIDNVWIESPKLVVDARLGVIYHPFGLIYPGLTYNLSSLGINGTNLPFQSFPGTSFSDSYTGLAAGAGGQISEFTLISPSLLISKTSGKHNLRFGFDSNFDRYNVQNPQSGLGTFAFDRRFTQENSSGEPAGVCPVGTGASGCTVGGDANSGNPVAAELVGTPSSGSYGNNVAYALQQVYYAGFIQDDWHITPKLTLNLGLRWDYESPFTERHNQLVSSFCTTCTNPLQSEVTGLSLPGGLQFVGYGNPKPFPSDYRHWQPRIGGAYQLMPRIVLRGGFGLVYLNTLESPLGTGFSASTSYVATTDNIHPANYFSNPFPSGIVLPSGNTQGLATALGQSVSYNDPNHVQPALLQYSVSTQVQLPANMILQVAYAGQQTSKIEINKSVDGLPRQYYNQGSAEATYLNTKVTNPMYGAALLPTSSSLDTPTILQSSLLVPYPEFTGVTDDYASTGSQLFNSLQISVVKRLGHGFSAQGNFNWEKLMDQNTYLNPGEDDFPNTFRYQDAIPTLIGNFIATYQIPTLLHSAIGREIVGGWTINTVLRAQNGSLVSSPSGVTLLSNPKLAHPTGTEYFNTCYENSSGVNVVGVGACASSSSTAAFEQHPSFTLNNIGPTLESVRTLVYPLLDTSIFKQIALYKTLNFEIRGEIYNIANTPIFGGPNTSLGSTAFGTISTSQVNDPRIIQLTGRLNF